MSKKTDETVIVWRSRNLHPAFSLLIFVAAVPSAQAQSPLAVPVDGEPFAARLTSVDAQGKLGFDVAGKPRTLAAADLVAWGQPAELRKGPILVLADGGFLPAAVLAADKAELSVDSARWGTLKLPLDWLAGIVFRPPPHPAELDALLDRVARGEGQTDRLILDNGDELTGLIEAENLGSDTLKIKGNLGPVPVAVRRIVALVFNPALRQQPAADHDHGYMAGTRHLEQDSITPGAGSAGAAWIGLADGGRLLAARLQLQGDSLELTTLSGAKWKAEATDLVFFMPAPARACPGRTVYLSDIRPNEYRFLPYLETKWPYQTDRNVTGGQLRCGGRLYLKGLGVHSAAVLRYKLDRPWNRFQAEVGIDDSTGGRGSVGFRVFVDGKDGRKLKYTNSPIRGGMPPQAISIDLAGATQLDLVVDYGEAGDVMDHADWLNARLVK